MKTIFECFESENKSVNIQHSLVIFSPNGEELDYKILFKIHLLVDSNSKFISIYSDSDVNFFALLKHLENENLIKCNVLALMGQNDDAEIIIGGVSVEELTFTKKIIVYVNQTLAEEQKKILVSKGQKAGLELDIRDIEYLEKTTKIGKQPLIKGPSKDEDQKLSRTPTADVIRTLRQEVGFVCPVDGCQNPFLTWHHFDPPWHEKEHHNPNGMIALCRTHHDQADNGAFTKEQLTLLKEPKKNIVHAKFNWLRNKILVNVGGNYHYDVTDAISMDGQRWIWFDRDSQNNLLLNFSMPSTDSKPRSFIKQNVWYELGHAEDITCPPHGRLLKVKFANGDTFKIEYNEIKSGSDLLKKYPNAPTSVTGIESPEIDKLRAEGKIIPRQECQIEYPVTVIEISVKLKDGGIMITPSKFKGFNIKNCLFVNSPLNIKAKK